MSNQLTLKAAFLTIFKAHNPSLLFLFLFFLKKMDKSACSFWNQFDGKVSELQHY
jgi:hypothetical protein